MSLKSLCATGLPLFRIVKDTKRPATKNGFYDGAPISDVSFFDGYDVAVRCGDGFFVVDVDKRNNGITTLNGLTVAYGRLPETWTVKTPRDGFHFYFRGQVKTDHRTLEGIDIQSVGTYCVCPPSTFNGVAYEWIHSPDDVPLADAPTWLLDLLKNNRDPELTFSNKTATVYDLERLNKSLRYMDPDCDYDSWIKIGMAIHSTGLDEAYDTWVNWSRGDLMHKRAEKFNEEKIIKHWKSFKQDAGINFGTAFFIVENYLIDTTPEEDMPEVLAGEEIETDDDRWKREFNKELHETEFVEPIKGSHLDTIYRWMLKSCYVKHPEFALAGAISIVSTLLSRTWMHETKSYPITYNIIVGGASTGKDDYIKHVRAALNYVNEKYRTKLLCDEIRSDQAMKRLIGEYPARITLIDEIHEHIKRAYGFKDSPTKDIFRMLKEMWASQDIMMASVKRDSKETIRAVKNPRINLFGACTPEGLEMALKNQEVVDGGFFSRCDVWFEATSQDMDLRARYLERVKQKGIAVPDNVKAALSAIISKVDIHLQGEVSPHELDFREGNMTTLNADAANYYFEECANLNKYISLTDSFIHSVVNRCMEKVLRLSLIQAVCRESKAINKGDMEFAFKTIKKRLSSQLRIMTASLNTEHEMLTRAAAKRIVTMNERSPGELFTMREVFNGSRILRRANNSRNKLEVVNELLAAGAIIKTGDKKQNNSAAKYRVADLDSLEEML